MRLIKAFLYELKVSWHNLKDVFGSASYKERIVIIIGVLALIFYFFLFLRGNLISATLIKVRVKEIIMADWTAKQIQAPYSISYGFPASALGSTEGLEDIMRQYAQAGVNIVQINAWWEQPEGWKQALSQAAQKYQVGIMPWGFFDPSQRKAIVSEWSQDPATFGWYGWDEPGRDARTLEGMQQTYQEMKGYIGEAGLPQVSIWDDPVWGMNIGPGVTDIMGYAVAYPWGTDIEDPLAFTTGRTGLYTGTLEQAQQAGVTVIPVLQSWINAGVTPDILGQYGAYQEAFPFSGGAYYYDPEDHIISEPAITSYIQSLYQQLGGAPYMPIVPPTDGDEGGEPAPQVRLL